MVDRPQIFKAEGLSKILDAAWESRNKKLGQNNGQAFAIPAINFYNLDQLAALMAVSAVTGSPLVVQACPEYVKRIAAGDDDTAHVQGWNLIAQKAGYIFERDKIVVTSSQNGTAEYDNLSRARIIFASDHFDIKSPEDVGGKRKELERLCNETSVGLLRVNAAGFLGPYDAKSVISDIVAMASQYGVAVEAVYSNIDATGNMPGTVSQQELVDWVGETGVRIVNFDVGTYHGGSERGAANFDVSRLRGYMEALNQEDSSVRFLLHGGSSVLMPGHKEHDQSLLPSILGYTGVFNIATNTNEAYVRDMRGLFASIEEIAILNSGLANQDSAFSNFSANVAFAQSRTQGISVPSHVNPPDALPNLYFAEPRSVKKNKADPPIMSFRGYLKLAKQYVEHLNSQGTSSHLS